jgi:hypothetical protein
VESVSLSSRAARHHPRRAARPVDLGLGMALVLAPAACRQIVGIDETQVAAAHDSGADVGAGLEMTATACGLPYGTATCASCVAASCCNESSACAANATCKPYAACVGSCGTDSACRAQCVLDVAPPKRVKAPRSARAWWPYATTHADYPAGPVSSIRGCLPRRPPSAMTASSA